MNVAEPRILTEDPPTIFLLAEHARLAQLYLETRETAERRVTLFLTLTTTIVGAMIALFQFKLAPRDFLETAIAGAIGVLLLGASTFHRVIERSMQGTEYLRAINRIHHFFVERAPEITPYLYWPPFDDIPHFDFHGVGGAETREIVMLIDSLFFGAAVGLSVLIAVPNLLIAALAPGAVGVGVAVYMHRWYERFSMAREERRKKQQVRFPEKA